MSRLTVGHQVGARHAPHWTRCRSSSASSARSALPTRPCSTTPRPTTSSVAPSTRPPQAKYSAEREVAATSTRSPCPAQRWRARCAAPLAAAAPPPRSQAGGRGAPVADLPRRARRRATSSRRSRCPPWTSAPRRRGQGQVAAPAQRRGGHLVMAANAWLSQLPKTYDEAKVGLGPATVLVGARRLPPRAPTVPTSAH